MGQLRRHSLNTGVLALVLGSTGFALALGVTGATAPGSGATATSSSPLDLSVNTSRALTLRNVSGAPMRLRSALLVEAVDAAGNGKRLTVQNLLLRATCTPRPEAIIVLAPGAALTALPWTGRHCASQCDESCRAEADYPPGQYRYVVQSESGREWLSASFALTAK